MRNIPVFTTEFGVASLVLKEVPYTKTAYIHLHSSLQPEKLLKECVDFCRAAGAERVYATGNEVLKNYPFHTNVLAMQYDRPALGDTTAQTIPVNQETLDQWRRIYNEKMAGVDNASYMDETDGKKMLLQGQGYFVIKDGKTIGLLMTEEDKLLAVAAVVPGAGKDCMLALKKLLKSEKVFLEVASTNRRAVSLYEKLGFVQTEVISDWYKIL